MLFWREAAISHFLAISFDCGGDFRAYLGIFFDEFGDELTQTQQIMIDQYLTITISAGSYPYGGNA